MNLPLLLACLALVLPCAGQSVTLRIPAVEVVDLERLRLAIAQVETGNRNVVGRHGEVGPLQSTSAARATVRGGDRAYLAWLLLTVPQPTPYRLALAWHAGPTGARHPTRRQLDYAARVQAVYGDLTRRQYGAH